MRWCASIVLVWLAMAVAAPESSAQWFGKKTKTPPAQRVPELIVTLKSDKDVHRRADAAEELRQYEPKEFPEIIPALIEALQTDSTTKVRTEAATSLGRLRPHNAAAGQALEKAAANDANLSVRLQAKTSLVYYQLTGYHAPKKTEPQTQAVVGRTDEPPLAGNGNEPWWKNAPAPKAPPGQVIPGAPNAYRPLPSGPTASPQVPILPAPNVQPQPAPQQGPLLPMVPPALQTPPQPIWAPVQDQGPSLMPPK